MPPPLAAVGSSPLRRLPAGSGAATLAWVYASFSALWILFSDKAVEWWIQDPGTAAILHTLKGWLFVAVTSALLYVMARRLLRSEAGPVSRGWARGSFPVAAPLLLIIVALAVLAVTGISASIRSHRHAEVAKLHTMADLKTRQIADWLGERYSDMRFIQGSRYWPQLYDRWQRGHDQDAGALLQNRISEWREAKGYDGVTVHDAEGRVVWRSDAAPDGDAVSPSLASTLRSALASRQLTHLGPSRQGDKGLGLDFIVPMTHGTGPAAFAVVLHLDATRPLRAMLDGWPMQDDGVELVLVRRDGGRLLYLYAAQSPAPPESATATAGQRVVEIEVLNGQASAGTVISGVDSRGRAVVAISQIVPGTDWLLVARIDEATLYGASLKDSIWIVLALLLVALIASGAVITLRQRQALAASHLQSQAQAEKLALQAQLSHLAESLPGMLYSFQRGADGHTFRMLYASPATRDLMGLDPAALAKDPGLWLRQIHQDDLRHVLQGMNESAAHLTPASSEWRQMHPTKGERWLAGRSMPEREADGSTVWHGYLFDVTAEKDVARALRLSQAQLEDAQRAAHLGHYRFDVATGLWTCSVTLGELFGVKPETPHDLNGWLALIHPDDRESMTAYLRDDVIGQARPFDREYRICRASDGATRWVHGLGRLRLDDDGRPVRMVGTIQDITERKLAEQQVRQLSLAVEQSPESVVITNLDGKIEYVNEAFVKITGYSRDEVMGRRPTLLRAHRDHRAQNMEIRETLLRGESWKGKFTNRRKDGSEYVEFAIVSPIRQPDGTITHYVAVNEDITEKQRLTEELDQHRHHLEDLVAARTAELAQARERAEAANQAKSAFLANMSHEIRTPMNAIIGLTALLQRSGMTPQQTERLRRIDTAAHHLLGMLNDVLDFSKIEAGRIELEQTDFSLDVVLDEVRSLIAQPAAAKGLVIDMQSQCPGLWLHGDPTRLRQALLNYATNAVKFTERGIVRLHVQRLPMPPGDKVTPGSRAVMLRFEVEDTGIGMAPDRLDHLFQAFEQADASITRRHGGSGLGLSITRRLAELMGGTVGASSVPGQGSRFWFTAQVPLAHPGDAPAGRVQAPVERGDATQPGSADPQRARILLVEDEPINREVARELLEGFGAEVTVATNGREALDHALAGHHDLVLMDLQMPELGGLDATQALRRLPGWAGVPIIALTANAFTEDRAACLEAGMNDYLCKPVEADALQAVLGRWLPGIASVDPAQPESTGGVAADAGPPLATRQTLARLVTLLDIGDIEASTLAEREQGPLSAALGAQADTLFGLLRTYDFENAAALLRALQPVPLAPRVDAPARNEGVDPHLPAA